MERGDLMTDKSFEDYAKNRVRLTPETLTEKYYGLAFGMPFLLVLSLAVMWIAVGTKIGHSSYETAENIASARMIGVMAAIFVWAVAFTTNLADTGNGLLCRVGRLVMPVVDAMNIGNGVRRYAHGRARINPRELYDKAVAPKARTRTPETKLDLPWRRQSDPYRTRRYLQLVWYAISSVVFYLLVEFFWALGHMPDVIHVPYLFTLFTELLWYLGVAVIVLFALSSFMLFLVNEPDEFLGDADRMLSWLERRKRK
jgi:ABC-type multidrug transport system fused ATPase/permease subunit